MRTDLVRLEAVWNTGGIYLDSDIYLLQPIDIVLDNLLPTFWNANPSPSVSMSWLNAMFAATKHNPIIKELIHASGEGIEFCEPNLATACLVGYSKYLNSLDTNRFNWLGTDDIVFSDWVGNLKFDSFQEIVDTVVSTREKLPLGIHITQHTWNSSNQ